MAFKYQYVVEADVPILYAPGHGEAWIENHVLKAFSPNWHNDNGECLCIGTLRGYQPSVDGPLYADRGGLSLVPITLRFLED